jgi:hypothetical protein
LKRGNYFKTVESGGGIPIISSFSVIGIKTSFALPFKLAETDKMGRKRGMTRAGMYAYILLKKSKLQHF